jgi:hypothetical protein
MLATIRASQLNTFDPALSIQHQFDGKLRREKEPTQDFTSLGRGFISSFCDRCGRAREECGGLGFSIAVTW